MRVSLSEAAKFTAFAIILLLTPRAVLGATDLNSISCPTGMHAAGVNEVPGVSPGTCTPDSKTVTQSVLYGGCDTNPYSFLEQYKSGNIQLTPVQNGTNLQGGINPTLACRLMKFLQYAQQTRGCVFKISSGYRDAQYQAAVCKSICGNPNGCAGSAKCGSPGGSCHQYGLAVDITGTSQCMAWAKTFLGSKNIAAPGAQQFRLHWPIPSDDGHTQCIENTAGSCSTNTQPCGGNINIQSGPGMQYAYTPAAPFSNTLRSYLGMPTPPPPPQYLPTAQNPLQYYPQQTNPTQTSTLPPPVSGTISIDTTPVTATSAIDLIALLANPQAATSSATSGPASLNPNLVLIGQIQSQNPTPSDNSGSLAYVQPTVQNTFVSNDLSNAGEYSPQQLSTFQATLAQLKEALLKALAWLQPFRDPRRTAAVVAE